MSGSADARPAVSISVSSAEVGAPIAMTYAARGIAPSQKLVVQRQEGTGKFWRSILNVGRRTAGTAQLPPLPLGMYTIRLAVMGRRGRLIAQRAITFPVFGEVPFSRLIGDGNEGTYTLPTSTFQYAIHNYGAADPTAGTLFTITKNPCRSVHVEFVPGTENGNENLHGELGSGIIVQESLDPIKVTVPGQTVGTFDAALIPRQSWSLNVEEIGGNRLLTWYVNGHASCDRERLEG
jgi:hypothetical protein